MWGTGCRGLQPRLWWSPRTFSRPLAGQNPEPGLGVAGARARPGLGVLDLEPHPTPPRPVGFAVVVAPHPRRPPPLPVLFAALVFRNGHGRQKDTTYFQPAVDVLEKSGLFGARHVDYGVKGDSG